MGDKVDYYLDFTPTSMELNGRTMTFDTLYPSSYRGLIKVVEIILCFLAMLLVACSQGVQEERSLALFAAFLGMGFAFTLLFAYIFMLNSKISQTFWFAMEGFFYLVIICLLLSSGVSMAYFCAAYWAERNPAWQLVPSLAAGTLFVAMFIFSIDLILLIRYWKRYSWHPQTDYSPRPISEDKTVLPY